MIDENDLIKSLPVFNDPMKAAEYAMEWQGKAVELNKFYWKVEDILRSSISSEEKIDLITELLPNYGWV